MPWFDRLEPRLLLTGDVGGTVFDDLDRDGLRDPAEPGVEAVTVYLDENNNSVLDEGEPTRVTDVTGRYLFSGLDAGDRVVRQVVPEGFVQTAPIEQPQGTGDIAFFRRLFDGQGGIDGLNGVSSVAISPDDAHVYVAGTDDADLGVFGRDAGTGALTFLQVIKSSDPGVDGLDAPVFATVSPDGAHVYVLDWGNGGSGTGTMLSVFSRDAATGALTFVATRRQPEAGFQGIRFASDLVFSPDGSSAYVLNDFVGAIAVFDRDPATGLLAPVETLIDDGIPPGSSSDVPGAARVDGLAGLAGGAVAPDGAKLYAIGLDDSRLLVFDRDAGTGALSLETSLDDGVGGVTGMLFPEDLVMTHDGTRLFVISSSDDALTLFDRNPATGDLAFNRAFFDGVDGFEQPSARELSVSADGQSLLIWTYDRLLVYDIDPATDGLTLVETVADTNSSSAPAGATLIDGFENIVPPAHSSDGSSIYYATSDSDALHVFDHDGATSDVSVRQRLQDGDDGVDGLDGASESVVSPDGRHVYTVSRDEDAIAIFTRERPSGDLAFAGLIRQGDPGIDGLDSPSGIAVSPDGLNLYVYSGRSGVDSVSTFRRDADTGDLAFVQVFNDGANGVDGLRGVADVTVSPDGRHVYAVGRLDRSLVIFERDAATGALTFRSRLIQGSAGVDGLLDVQAVAVSADNRFVYTVASNYMAVFTRDALSGALIPAQVIFDQPNLNGALRLVISPDQRHVYVGGGQRLAVFQRDFAGGTVSFVQLIFRQHGSTAFATDVRVTSDGTQVIAAGRNPATLYVYDRDADAGELTLAETLGPAQVPDFSVSTAALSDDGISVYVSGFRGLTIFDRDGGASLPGAQVVSVVDGQVVDDVDFGIAAAAFSGTVFDDLNDNGVLDPGEPGMPGVTVYVDLDQDDVPDPGEPVTVTDAGGNYLIAGIAPGLYQVRQVLPADFLQTVPSTEFEAAGALSFVEQYFDGRDGVDGLNRPVDAAASPDGAHVFVVGSNNDSISVFARNGDAEPLTLSQVVRNGLDGVIGLDQPLAVAVSSDGNNVYVSGESGATVVVLEWDAAGGELSFVETLSSGDLDGIVGLDSMTMSPDGAHLYLTSRSRGALVVLSRDAVDHGRLTRLQILRQDDAGVEGLNGVIDLVVSPDGAQVYVLNNASDGQVTIYARDTAAGTLALQDAVQQGVDGVDGLRSSQALTLDAAGTRLYVVSSLAPRAAVFARDAATGALTLEQTTDVTNPRDVAISADGLRLYVASFAPIVTAFDVDPVDGTITFDEQLSDGDGLGTPFVVAPDPTADALYLPSDPDMLQVVADDDDSLSLVQTLQDGDGGDDGLSIPQDLAISADGRFVYVAATGEESIAVYERDPESNTLSFRQVLRDDRDGVDGLNSAQAVAISPDGAHVYVSAFRELGIFSRDAATGLLTFLDALAQGVDGVDGLSAGRKVRISPDGAHVYVASESDKGIGVFSRDAATGALTFVELVEDGVNGVDGLDRIRSVAISPGGEHVYAVGGGDDAVVTLSRDPATGMLSFVEVLTEANTGIETLDNPLSVVVSPDGRHVIVGGSSFRNLASFTRDPGTGRLAFIEELNRNPDGLDTNTEVVFSPDGFNLYVSSSQAHAVSMLQFDRDIGRMTLVQSVRDGEGAEGLESIDSLAITPDGTGVYAVGTTENALVALDRDPGSGLPGAHRVSIDAGQAIGGLNFGNLMPAVTIAASDPDASEPGSEPGRFTIARTGPTTDPVTVNLVIGGDATRGEDYTDIDDSVVIAANDRSVDVTITPVEDDLAEGTESVVLTLGPGDYLVGGADSATVEIEDGVLTMPLGDDGTFEYVDASGDDVLIALKGPGGGEVVLPPDGGDALAILLSGTTVASTLTITPKGPDKHTTVTDIVVDGPLKSLGAKSTDLLGDLTTGPVSKVVLRDVADDHTIIVSALPDTFDEVTFAFDRVVDLVIESALRIKSLTASEWLDASGVTDVIDAPSLGKLDIRGNRKRGVRGDFEADLKLAGAPDLQKTLGNVKIAGDARQVDIDVAKDAGNVSIKGAADTVFINATGAIRKVSVARDAALLLVSALQVDAITVGGTWSNGGGTIGAVKSIATKANRKLDGDAGAGDLINVAFSMVRPLPGSDPKQWLSKLSVAGRGDRVTIADAGQAGRDLGALAFKGGLNRLTIDNETGALKSLKAGAFSNSTITGTDLGAIQVASAETVTIDAHSAKAIELKGDRRSGDAGDAEDVTIDLIGSANPRIRQTLGKLKMPGGARNLVAASIGDVGSVEIGGVVDGLDLTVASRVGSIRMGPVDAASIQGDRIESVRAVRWTSGSLEATTLGALATTGDRRSGEPGAFAADVTVTGDGDPATTDLGKAAFKGALEGQWLIEGDLGPTVADAVGPAFSARISGRTRSFNVKAGDFEGWLAAAQLDRFDVRADVRNATIIAGGPAATPNAIGSVKVGGSLFDSVIQVGVRPGPDTVLGTADDEFVFDADHAIGALTVGGVADADQPIFYASAFPATVTIDGERFAGPLFGADPRFELILP